MLPGRGRQRRRIRIVKVVLCVCTEIHKCALACKLAEVVVAYSASEGAVGKFVCSTF